MQELRQRLQNSEINANVKSKRQKNFCEKSQIFLKEITHKFLVALFFTKIAHLFFNFAECATVAIFCASFPPPFFTHQLFSPTFYLYFSLNESTTDFTVRMSESENLRILLYIWIISFRPPNSSDINFPVAR